MGDFVLLLGQAMSGLVERLRRGVYPDETGFSSTEGTMLEAADEIERLRAALEYIAGQLEQLMRENARLRAALSKYAEDGYNGYNGDGKYARRVLAAEDKP